MFKIIIHVFKMEINCILMKYILIKYYLLCMIIIHVFQMDINCILMKYYFHASCFMLMLILVFQKYCICILINETLFSCL